MNWVVTVSMNSVAFWNNEIDYNKFYITRNDTANFAILRTMLQAPNAV